MFSSACVALAVAAHLAAQGRAPAGWAVGAAVAGVALVTGPLAGRHRSGTMTGTVMIVVQAALHVWFSLSAPPTTATHTSAIPATVMPATVMPGMGTHGMTMGPWMVTAHLVAALGASWFLWRCDEVVSTAAILTEALFAALFTAVRVLLVPLARPVARERWVGGTRRGAGPLVRAALLVRNCVVRRGPPAGAGLAITVTA